MRDSKKAIIAVLFFCVCFFLFTFPFIHYSGHEERICSYILLSDAKNMNIPADTDLVFCGSSQCAMSFIPDVVDRNAGTHSYNLSVQAMRWSGRYELLKTILPKYPIKTVILEVSYDSLSLKDEERMDGKLQIFQYYRQYLSTNYKLKNMPVLQYFDRIQTEYSQSMQSGFDAMLTKLKTGSFAATNVIYNNKAENRGYECYPSQSVALSPSDASNMQGSVFEDSAFIDENIKRLSDCISLCKENNVDVLLVVVPVSDAFLWKHANLDRFHDTLVQISENTEVTMIDFNLLKSRKMLFQDDVSFYNETHLSETGAGVFSEVFSNYLISDNSEEIDCDYFDSYTSMLKTSPYFTEE